MIISGSAIPVALTLSGGVWIVMAVFLIGFIGLIWGYFTEKGTEIRFHPWGDRGGDAPGSLGVGNVGKDRTVDVRTWTRGTSARGHRNRPAPSEEARTKGDPEMLAKLADWRRGLTSDYAALSVPPDPGRDHMVGPPDARLQLVEYTDFECPSCQETSLAITRVREHYGDELLIVVRHFPIIDAHPIAMYAAETVEAAAAQGQFWEMYRRIYLSRDPPTEKSLNRFARSMGLDLDRFESEIRDHTYTPRIREDFETGLESGVNATPTIFVNGFRRDDDHTYDTLVAALDDPNPY
jgi:protein-disulfide isomerase